MSGIFNYQVPGQKPQVNQPEMSSSTTNQFNQNSSQSFQQAPGLSFNIQQLVSLLQQLLQQLNSHSDNTPPSEGTTQALGEEDGGRPPSEKPCHKPPEATTNALGEKTVVGHLARTLLPNLQQMRLHWLWVKRMVADHRLISLPRHHQQT